MCFQCVSRAVPFHLKPIICDASYRPLDLPGPAIAGFSHPAALPESIPLSYSSPLHIAEDTAVKKYKCKLELHEKTKDMEIATVVAKLMGKAAERKASKEKEKAGLPLRRVGGNDRGSIGGDGKGEGKPPHYVWEGPVPFGLTAGVESILAGLNRIPTRPPRKDKYPPRRASLWGGAELFR